VLCPRLHQLLAAVEKAAGRRGAKPKLLQLAEGAVTRESTELMLSLAPLIYGTSAENFWTPHVSSSLTGSKSRKPTVFDSLNEVKPTLISQTAKDVTGRSSLRTRT
jgi:hypothetical protein